MIGRKLALILCYQIFPGGNNVKLRHRKLIWAGTGAMLVFALAGCSPEPQGVQPPVPPPPGQIPTNNNAAGTGTPEQTSATTATAVIYPTKGNKAQGTLHFVQEEDGLHITGEITGLTPGKHGFHAHQNGDCSSADASSAGGHFNPEEMPHGAEDAAKRHAGDFGNIIASQTGSAHIDKIDKVATLSGKDSIIGRAIIIHQGADDLKSQPSGDAGARVACGVVGVEK